LNNSALPGLLHFAEPRSTRKHKTPSSLFCNPFARYSVHWYVTVWNTLLFASRTTTFSDSNRANVRLRLEMFCEKKRGWLIWYGDAVCAEWSMAVVNS